MLATIGASKRILFRITSEPTTEYIGFVYRLPCVNVPQYIYIYVCVCVCVCSTVSTKTSFVVATEKPHKTHMIRRMGICVDTAARLLQGYMYIYIYIYAYACRSVIMASFHGRVHINAPYSIHHCAMAINLNYRTSDIIIIPWRTVCRST